MQGLNRSTNGLKQWCSFDPNLFISRNSKEALVPQKDTMVPVRVEKLELFVERYSKTQQSQTLAWNIVKQKKSSLTWLFMRAFKWSHVWFCFFLWIYFLVPTGVGCIAWRCSTWDGYLHNTPPVGGGSSNPGSSLAVSHPSTVLAQCSTTSMFERERSIWQNRWLKSNLLIMT